MRRRARELLVDRGGAIALAALVLYVWLAPAHVVDGDNAEFATLGAIGGRAHPTGYPAYVLCLRAMSWLPGSSAAQTAAIATAILAAAHVLVLHAACRAWGARASAATVAVAIFAASPVVLRTYTEAEVFALNGLVVSMVLWLAAAAGPLRGVSRGLALGLVAGLGLANHMSCALVAPVGIVGVVRATRESRIAIAAAIGGLVVGLLPYVYLVIAPASASFGRVDSVDDLLGFVLRRDYGGPGAFLANGVFVPITTNLGVLATTLGRAWLWIPGVLGVAMLGWRCVRSAGEPRAGWIALAASWLVAGPLLVARFNVDPHDTGLYVIHRFHLLPALLLAIPVAAAFDDIARRLGDRIRAGAIAATSIAVVGFAALAGLGLPRILAVHSAAMEDGVRNALEALPPNAIAVAGSDDQCFVAPYLQLVEGVRPDIAFVCWSEVSRDWYRERLPVRIPPQDGAPMTVALAEALLATGRPLFVDGAQPLVSAGLPNHPYGVLDRILPRDAKVPSVREVIALNRELYSRFDLDEPHPSQADDIAAVAYRRYAATWRMLAAAADSVGAKDDAAFAHYMAAELAPTP